MSLNQPVSMRSQAVIHHLLTLSTHIGLKTYNRTFSRLDAALYLADVIVRVQGRASMDYASEIGQVNDAIQRELERLTRFIQTESNWIARALKKLSIDAESEDMRYTHPAEVPLTMRTPAARQYARALSVLEGIGHGIDQAWYAGLLNTADQLQHANLLFRHCYRTCEVIERLARGLARRIHDDTELPGYRDMLVKRTGRGPDLDEIRGVIQSEGAEGMTPAEEQSLRDTEALAQSIMAVPSAEKPDPNGAAVPLAAELTTHDVKSEAAESTGAAYTEAQSAEAPDQMTVEGAAATGLATDAASDSSEGGSTASSPPSHRRLRDALRLPVEATE